MAGFVLTDPSRDPGRSLSPPTGCSSAFWFFFLFLLFNIFEKPLEPAFAVSDGPAPACDFGLSAYESIDERPLLGPEPSIARVSAGTVRAWPNSGRLRFSKADGAGGSSFESGGLSITEEVT